jgi:DNA-directed RNA polymerase subunit alpha
MLEIDSFAIESPIIEEKEIFPAVNIVESTNTYGKFEVEPLERGYGITLGNPVRRTLLSSVEGAAITWVKIDDVLHEYSTIPHVKEEVMEILHNISQVSIRPITNRPGKMRLEVKGEGVICAGDIATSSDFEIVNPEQHIATLDSDKAELSVELNVEPGKGYKPASQGEGLPRGVLPLDAGFSPVLKVNYSVEKTRIGQVTDYERLVFEIWTDGSITPLEALKSASDILVNHFFLFSNIGKPGDEGQENARLNHSVTPEIYQTTIEKLNLSPRTLNSLKRANLKRVGEILELSNEDLFGIRNFGVKSLNELNEKLEEFGYTREGQSSADISEDDTEPSDAVPAS